MSAPADPTDPMDPFAVEPDGPMHLVYYATILTVTPHAIYRATYRCLASLLVSPWTIRRSQVVTAYRGETHDSPVIGTAKVAKLRRGRDEVKEILVGMNESGDVEFEVILDQEIAALPGDKFTFNKPATWPE